MTDVHLKEKIMYIPTQTYKPKDLDQEVKRIKSFTWEEFDYYRNRHVYKDEYGNIFDIDFNEGTISIN